MLLDCSLKSARIQVGGLPASIFSIEVARETKINLLQFSDWIESPKLAHKLLEEQLSHSFLNIIFADFWMWSPSSSLTIAISLILPAFFLPLSKRILWGLFLGLPCPWVNHKAKATDDLKYCSASCHSYLLGSFSKDKVTVKLYESSSVHYIFPVMQVSFHIEYELE